MDLQSLYYFSELAKDLHITRTAKRLFLSQQTLSNHIQRLEEFYGAELMKRKPVLAFTPAGEAVLEFARLIFKEQDKLKVRLSDICEQEQGIIRFGASMLEIESCITKILPEFVKRYPNVEIHTNSALSSKLAAMIHAGDLDLAITYSSNLDSSLSFRYLADDPILMCVPEELLKRFYPDDAKAIKEKSMEKAYVRDFSKLSFCMLSNSMGPQIEKCFAEAGFVPNVYMTSAFSRITSSICAQNQAVSFITRSALSATNDFDSKDIHFFPLYSAEGPVIQKIYLIWDKELYLTGHIKYFIDLVANYRSKPDIQLAGMDASE